MGCGSFTRMDVEALYTNTGLLRLQSKMARGTVHPKGDPCTVVLAGRDGYFNSESNLHNPGRLFDRMTPEEYKQIVVGANNAANDSHEGKSKCIDDLPQRQTEMYEAARAFIVSTGLQQQWRARGVVIEFVGPRAEVIRGSRARIHAEIRFTVDPPAHDAPQQQSPADGPLQQRMEHPATVPVQ